MPQSPKKNLTRLRLKGDLYGPLKRIENTMDAFNKNMVFPKPVEYEDIDGAVLEFVKNNIHLVCDGNEAPTFTLFSNQRFSEYSQTWKHVDKEGNLLMDFKTVNRDPNPSWGNNQGGAHNIPGDRRYTIQIKETLDDNGTESYEVYSMGQPLSIDLSYTINYVTADWDKLNDFNLQLNELFKAIQCYIKPNGWYMPMKIESIGDDTEYAIDNRKIFIQSASITVQGIISPKSSYKIEKFPKRLYASERFDLGRIKANVDVEEGDNSDTITIDFGTGSTKTEFVFDDFLQVYEITSDNVRDFSIYIDGDKVNTPNNGFVLSDGSEVKIKINQIDRSLPSKLVLKGFKM
jgi:hypothetical protein